MAGRFIRVDYNLSKTILNIFIMMEVIYGFKL